jgi:hypothetical protein
MGKKKIDKLHLIENVLQRNVAFCKRKRGFLKKAIELSKLCDQKILVMIYDHNKNKMTQFSSDLSFDLKQAYESKQKIQSEKLNFELFTNDDF